MFFFYYSRFSLFCCFRLSSVLGFKESYGWYFSVSSYFYSTLSSISCFSVPSFCYFNVFYNGGVTLYVRNQLRYLHLFFPPIFISFAKTFFFFWLIHVIFVHTHFHRIYGPTIIYGLILFFSPELFLFSLYGIYFRRHVSTSSVLMRLPSPFIRTFPHCHHL